MLYDVKRVNYIEEYTLEIEFENGYTGIIDLKDYKDKGGVFTQFNDLNFFRNYTVSKELGTIVWNNEIDIAPETLYSKCKSKL